MGSCTDHSDGAHSGKLFRQYGKFTISGHCSMVGVPRSLRDLLRVETIREALIRIAQLAKGEPPEDAVNLVDLGVSRKQRLHIRHFSDDATDAPHVHESSVHGVAQQDLRGAVPARDDLQSNGELVSTALKSVGCMIAYFNSEWLQGGRERTSQSEVCYF